MIEFKKGDKVRLIDSPSTQRDHKNHPEYYPEPGTVGTVYDDSGLDGTTLVEWPQAAIQGARRDWWAHSTDLERVNDAAPDYYIRVTATSKDGAQVEVNGPAAWVHEALAQVVMKLNPSDPFGVLAAVLARALSTEEDDDDE
mgnify:CR=1 FL=1